MKKTLWIRPANQNNYMIFEKFEDGFPCEVIMNHFESNCIDKLRLEIEKKEKWEGYDDFDNMKYNQVHMFDVDTEDGYKEIIEFKLVEMGEGTLENLSEFGGW
jgi:hypothetical protein